MHKPVLVIGDDIEGQLELYDEELIVPPYTEEVDYSDILCFLDYYLIPEDKVKLQSYSEQEAYEAAHFMYRSKGSSWNNNQWAFDLTIPQVLSTNTHNPKGEWDWYDIGGRYCNLLICKDKSEKYTSNISALDISATVYNPEEYISAVIIDSLWLDNGDYPNYNNFEYFTLAESTHCWEDFVIKVLELNKYKKVTVVDLHF